MDGAEKTSRTDFYHVLQLEHSNSVYFDQLSKEDVVHEPSSSLKTQYTIHTIQPKF